MGSRRHPVYPPLFQDRRRERQFVSSIGFVSAFAVTRAITHALHSRPGRFARIFRRPQRRHHHHLVVGILLLLADGYAWLLQVGTGIGRASPWGSRLTALLYGIGSALTLDEFALWLDLRDEYWSRQGRKSVDAVLLFGALLSAGIWDRQFLRGLVRQASHALGR